MATNVTHLGQQHALGELVGGIIIVATKIKLYTGASTPNKDGTGFVEAANGNGYLTGGVAIVTANWLADLFSGNRRVRLKPSGNDVAWVASGGSIVNIAGAMLTNAGNAVLAWWPRVGGAVNIAPGEDVTLVDLTLSGQ